MSDSSGHLDELVHSKEIQKVLVIPVYGIDLG